MNPYRIMTRAKRLRRLRLQEAMLGVRPAAYARAHVVTAAVERSAYVRAAKFERQLRARHLAVAPTWLV